MKITKKNIKDVFKFKKTGKKISKIIGNNTLEVTYADNHKAIRLHDTDIISYIDDDIILDSGGWQTVTTKNRINQYLPDYQVYQKNFDWFVIKVNDWDNPKPFKDGMSINKAFDCK